ncbi:hypothetical protein AAFC00_005003 [Neodothiora populina]|uniref:Rhodopsin domain-containing protein n=1 Tax=Neodothiora populina TaxID=2781224 RepID=A0ABR3P4B5_9PEZI
MLWKLKIPLRQKLIISLLLSSGVFVIVAAIIRVVYSLDAEPSASNINRWGVRETIIGLFAINIPILRPIFRRTFWTSGKYDPSSPPSAGSRPTNSKRYKSSGLSGCDVELGTTTVKSITPRRANSTSSQENLVRMGKDNVVYVQTTYDIQSHSRQDVDSVKVYDKDWDDRTVTTP